ncbi:hypothetical protein HK405_007620, partial [Cladochytrium tenue]
MATSTLLVLDDSVAPVAAGDPLPRRRLLGRRMALEPIAADAFNSLEPGSFAANLFRQTCVDDDAFLYMPAGPFPDVAAYAAAMQPWTTEVGRQMYLVRDRETGRIAGHIAFLNLRAAERSVEIGMIWVAPAFRRQAVAIEATYLLLAYAIETLGYVRVEWKCHHLNVPSQRTALSIGFTYEGTFRKHMFFKGMVRHSMWYSIIDDDWPQLSETL